MRIQSKNSPRSFLIGFFTKYFRIQSKKSDVKFFKKNKKKLKVQKNSQNSLFSLLTNFFKKMNYAIPIKKRICNYFTGNTVNDVFNNIEN